MKGGSHLRVNKILLPLISCDTELFANVFANLMILPRPLL